MAEIIWNKGTKFYYKYCIMYVYDIKYNKNLKSYYNSIFSKY